MEHSGFRNPSLARRQRAVPREPMLLATATQSAPPQSKTLRALNDKRPKPRVLVGKGASRLAKLRLLRDRTRDRVLLNAFGVAKLRG
jgi:hypothetical protein